jgi:ubiquinone biosynthesis protein
MKVSTLDKVRENLRLQQVYNTLLRYTWDVAVFDRPGILGDFHRSMQAWAWDLPKDLETPTTPVKVRLMLEELGPTYVKMGQIISSQSMVIPSEWEVELEKLQNEVPPFPSELVEQVIQSELKASPQELYATFEPLPFAAASTAQVHKATLNDGTPVVVKVQRPNIYSQMKADIGIMQNAARVVSRRSEYARSIDLVGMLEQFGSSVLSELDYTEESFNAFRLQNSLKDLPGVRIPTIYPQLSTGKVITEELVRGVKISNTQVLEEVGLDREELAKNVLRAIIKQLLIDGFFHADPHPGNLLVNLDTGDIYFIDTGMVGELDVQQRLNLVQLMVTVQQTDIPNMARIMRSMSVPFVDKVDDAHFYHDFERQIGKAAYSGGFLSFGQSVNAAFDLLREHGLRLNPNLTMAIKALTQADAIFTALAPNGNLVAEAVLMVKDMFLESVTAEKVLDEAKKQVTTTAREVLKRVPSLAEASLKWIEQYQKGRFEVHVDTSELAKEVDKLGSMGRQVVIAIILVGMIIGSAIAASSVGLRGLQGEEWNFLFRLAYAGYILSMLVAILIVFRLVWQWLRGKPTK